MRGYQEKHRCSPGDLGRECAKLQEERIQWYKEIQNAGCVSGTQGGKRSSQGVQNPTPTPGMYGGYWDLELGFKATPSCCEGLCARRQTGRLLSETLVGHAGSTMVDLRTGEILETEAGLVALLTGSECCDVAALDHSGSRGT